MNIDYVKALSRPTNDEDYVRIEAKELVEGKTYQPDLIEYAINNFLESVQAYEDDFDPQKLYYQAIIQDNIYAMMFEKEYLAHLLGLPNYRFLKEAEIINQTLNSMGQLHSVNAFNWLETFKRLFSEAKTTIIAHDSDASKVDEKKLNWDKIAEKVFCFLNIGIISQGDSFCYREDVAKGKESGFVIARNVLTEEISGQVRMRFDYDIVKFPNGKRERVLVPVSIIFEENPPRRSVINMNGKNYRFMGKITIKQVMGGSYGR